jgi:hypothetical protein
MDFGLKGETLHLATGLTSLGVGIAAWEYQATSKYSRQSGYAGLLNKARFEDALAGLVGNKAVRAMDSTYQGMADFRPSPLGAINKTSIGGAILKIFNLATRKMTEKYIEPLPDFLDAAANGLIAGGIIGGVFDPPATSTPNASMPSSGAVGGSPLGAYVDVVSAHNRSIRSA